MKQPRTAEQKAAQRVAASRLLRGRVARERAQTSRWSQARQVACEQVGLRYQSVDAPMNEADLRFLTTLPPDLNYAQRQRLDRMRQSAEILTESVRG